MRRYIKQQQGLSLIELVIVLSLLGMVLAAGYNYLSFGLSSYARGEKQTVAQHGLRLTSNYVKNELRYASLVEIIVVPDGFGSNDAAAGYGYFYTDNNSIIHIDPAGQSKVLADGPADELDYSVTFLASNSEQSYLDTYAEYLPEQFYETLIVFILDADQGFYTLGTSVQILNLELYENEIQVDPAAKTAMRYKKPLQ